MSERSITFHSKDVAEALKLAQAKLNYIMQWEVPEGATVKLRISIEREDDGPVRRPAGQD